MCVIEDDGAGDGDAELVVGEVLVDVVQVRAVGPESVAAVEHYTHNNGDNKSELATNQRNIISDRVFWSHEP
jgi:hypothetical protein